MVWCASNPVGVFGSPWRLQVARRRHRDPPHLADLACDQGKNWARWPIRTAASTASSTRLTRLSESLSSARDLRIALEIIGHRPALTCSRPKPRGADITRPPRPLALSLAAVVGLLHIGEDASRPLQVTRADIGQPTCRVARCNSRAPRRSSNAAISRVTPEGDSPSRAAGAKPRRSATATKTCMASIRSMALLHIWQW